MTSSSTISCNLPERYIPLNHIYALCQGHMLQQQRAEGGVELDRALIIHSLVEKRRAASQPISLRRLGTSRSACRAPR